jgi:mannose-6-phosphate isomerase-like protein (cupin superfamily)
MLNFPSVANKAWSFMTSLLDRPISLSPKSTLDSQTTSDVQPLRHLVVEIDWKVLEERHDRAIVILEGNGWLTLAAERVNLQPGMVVLIPAHTACTLHPFSPLLVLLNRCDFSPVAMETGWVIHL